MNKLQTNALRIAELLEYDEWRLNNIQDVLICRYTAYDYLMPIVFECNSNDYISFTMTSGCFHVTEVNTTKPMKDRLNNYTFNNTEPEFIEAIQLACIKYLELKNDN